MAKKKQNQPEGLHGSLWLNDSQSAFAADQVNLLIAIEENGSISSAAKQVGISYKTAWDRVDAMNNMAQQPLVDRAAGGAHGGGTSLTAYGKEIVRGFVALQREHEAFMRQLSRKVNSFTDIADFMTGGTLKTSVRNQFRGVVSQIIPGTVNNEVHIRISESSELVAIVSDESCQALGIEPDVRVIALVEASAIMLSRDSQIQVSARNRLAGKIKRIIPGAVNCDVVVDIGDSKSLSLSMTNRSAEKLALQEGDDVMTFFKSSAVMLLIEA
ncbi:MAG: molybdenum-dependent transcriptional regulator [Oceanospirillaceae bacterium]|uniref:TOBE domain-containing protein n=1 Tax=unclassified Thalassolituus TaxID=2624967 RepID=UPI000C4988CA|nr:MULTISPECIES: TOBE domain-containing protein [unclassified Thalassolituus]MBS54090.1 molybdenum-dependent transcriptional regulator [Oceanospirillaceae bacterium]|tara:strand:+ start:3894 stop:4706 length:813 start_codon:yes stop_codon:yes gene_type:complete